MPSDARAHGFVHDGFDASRCAIRNQSRVLLHCESNRRRDYPAAYQELAHFISKIHFALAPWQVASASERLLIHKRAVLAGRLSLSSLSSLSSLPPPPSRLALRQGLTGDLFETTTSCTATLTCTCQVLDPGLFCDNLPRKAPDLNVRVVSRTRLQLLTNGQLLRR